MRILLDLDEVLADFVDGACRLIGVTEEQLWERHAPGQWSIMPALGVSDNEFWQQVAADERGFWLGLKPTRWMYEIVRLANKHSGNDWWIVTSPSNRVEAYSAKVEWVRLWAGKKFDRVIVTSYKHLLAKPSVVLIDDRERTLARFKEAGGDGILFPCKTNSLYATAHRPVKHVVAELERYRRLETLGAQSCT